MNWKRQSLLMIGTIAFLVIMSLVVSAQDPTQIPTLPDETEESAAPGIGIQPPDNPVTVEEPEATADPESTEEAVTETITTVSTCPIGVQDAYTATELICTGLASGEGCIGNGSVSTTFGAEVTGLSFANANDRVRLSSIDQLTLSSSSAWSVVSGRLELKTKVGNTVAADFLLVGDVTLSDSGRAAATGAANATVIAQRGMNVRRTPANDGVVVWQLQGGEEVTVTGITADRVWIRIVIPNEFAATGWAYAPYLEVEGGVEVLPVVTANSEVPDLAPPEFGSMQSLELLSAVTPDECGASEPDSGMLIQSPSGTAESLRFQINGVIIEFNGTIYVHAQAGSALNVDILEGSASIIDAQGSTLGGVVNERLSAPLDENLAPSGAFTASNYDAADFENLPIRLLPRVIAFGFEPIDEAPVNTGGFVTSTPVGGSSEPVVQTSSECTLTAPNEVRNIRSGPSTLYEVVRTLQPNESVRAVGQAIGEAGLVWYQTDTGGWLREDSVSTSDECTILQVVETPPPPAATATPVVTGPSLSSPQLPAFACGVGATPNTASATSNGSELYVTIGGTWSVSAGTTVIITTQGGQLRPEFGDFIQLVGEDGTEIAASGENHSLRFTFTESRTFNIRFSAGNGDLVVMAASCE
jgi:uncharacterized protein YgiM (DUF1202 family)